MLHSIPMGVEGASAAPASAARRDPQKIVVLADPVFATDDPRVRARAAGGATKGSASSPDATPAPDDDDEDGAWDHRWRTLARLRFSRNEASAIARLDPAAAIGLDFEASKEWPTTADLRAYGVVHIATHGLVDARQPELSGLALSSVDGDGRARDGSLKLDDVYRLGLDADLVVPSACDSARRQTLSGEGVVGLTRACLHAGARRVLSTTWAVNDRATGEFLARFYRAHLQERPVAARATAQREAVRLSVPAVDWAGFALHGLE